MSDKTGEKKKTTSTTAARPARAKVPSGNIVPMAHSSPAMSQQPQATMVSGNVPSGGMVAVPTVTPPTPKDNSNHSLGASTPSPVPGMASQQQVCVNPSGSMSNAHEGWQWSATNGHANGYSPYNAAGYYYYGHGAEYFNQSQPTQQMASHSYMGGYGSVGYSSGGGVGHHGHHSAAQTTGHYSHVSPGHMAVPNTLSPEMGNSISPGQMVASPGAMTISPPQMIHHSPPAETMTRRPTSHQGYSGGDCGLDYMGNLC